MGTKRVVMTGATGMIGRELSRRLIEKGDELIVLSRNPRQAKEKVPGATAYLAWQAGENGAWEEQVGGAYAVISLAGEPLFGKRRLTKARIAYADRTRIEGVRGLVHAMRHASRKPKVFISGSSVGIYGFQGPDDATVTEDTPVGTDSWAMGNIAWEYEALQAKFLGIRTVLLRTGIVWGYKEGMVAQQIDQFKRGWGGVVSPGDQWLPWIHIADEVGIILRCLADELIEGPVNASAPTPIRYSEYAELLGEAVGKPARMKTPAFFLKVFMGEAVQMIMHNRRMLPETIQNAGYTFQFPDARQAIADLISQPKPIEV
jgi:uncharacterized protein (TIGR01777 family)